MYQHETFMRFKQYYIYMRILFITIVLLVSNVTQNMAQHQTTDLEVSQEYVLKRINLLRSNGCRCGNKRMKPVNSVTWNKKLEKSALMHAKEMYTYNFFGHRSINGEDIGDRLDDLGYKWQFVGENLANGQKSFDEAMKDWIKSPSHCEMLLNPNMKEVAVSRYGKYWVQHFGSLMPPNTRRTKITYSEGE